ncbi:GNAT family N-acetyltransferase [Paucibacter sp. XJ19-41]|uniref:GNAT family N-acetyltransferase n=1 Tax=Paucibacter sp. XJ19-41 TaxID=2927824 RepID=UPI00234B90FA|nr:GNAT family N-acetyltransferase [Paucibacter sp. XJ19-41]MDC6166016.1 GNAT family N-acetyltransferase [Paucibacter sp. XJ19-41]
MTAPETPSPTAAEPAPAWGPAAALQRWASWVPIRSLARRHRRRIKEHLLSLDARDRYLRFGYPASDEQIAKYAMGLNFDRDEVLGIFNRRLELVAMAHLAYEPSPQLPGKPAMAEFGVSVLGKARGRGFGARLFEHAALHARNRGIDTLFIHALSENVPMLRIARNAGAKVERDGSESEAWLRLPPDTVASHVGEAIERHMAELDFQFKRHARVFGNFIDGVAEIKSQFDDAGKAAKQYPPQSRDNSRAYPVSGGRPGVACHNIQLHSAE